MFIVSIFLQLMWKMSKPTAKLLLRDQGKGALTVNVPPISLLA